ncbi:MAG TPA: gamma-glutamyltransferase [Bauldia sp.]|nr:gamma-glutamyltransferase [Bauldia sp.]
MSETVVAEKGMVTAPHRAAAEAGAEVLRAGGNAVEAMIAAAAAIAVVYPHMTGIGGDAFMLIAEPGRQPKGIDGAGRAGAGVTIDAYRKKGYDAIPPRGGDAAITVAGAVSVWEMAAEIGAALGGRMPRQDLIAPAIALAKDGIPVTHSFATLANENLDELAATHGFAAHYLIEGKVPEIGSRLKAERLRDTLEQLAHQGYDDFYRGDIASEIAADLAAAGSPVTRADLASQRASLVSPLSVELSDATVFNMPPPTQGVASLIILGLFDRLKVKRAESFDHIHGLIEATKRAWVIRDREVADPLFSGDLAPYLSVSWLDAEAERIDMRRASPYPPGEPKGDTVWMGAIDARGVAVSFIQSIYFEFGSGVVLPRTGIAWHNRGLGFSLDAKSHRALAPGRKPFHTLNPPLARFRDGRVMTYGSMGGDGQPQFQAAIFTRYTLGADPGDALDRPRWRWGRTWGEGNLSGVEVESRFDPDLLAALERAGHAISVLDQPYSHAMGHAGMIVRHPQGRLFGASDPRSDGAAVAA